MALKTYSSAELESANLVIDAVYLGGGSKGLAGEVISKLLSAPDKKGGANRRLRVHNAGGFRFRGPKPRPFIVALTSNSSEPAWPDSIDPFTGQLTYFGDNRDPGPLHETHLGGNQILSDTFSSYATSAAERAALPVYLYFTKWGDGHNQQFRGLVVPGGVGVSRDDELTAIWRTKNGERFQNYRATFSVLDIPEIQREWLNRVIAGEDKLVGAPMAYRRWVESGKYTPLVAERVVQVRSKSEQLPQDPKGLKLVRHIHERFPKEKAYDFEAVALALWRLQCPLPVDAELTRKVVDGGRDAFGVVRVGPVTDPLRLDFALEAKCYAMDHCVTVSDTSRLISRLRRHHFGVVVTTSYVGDQAYREIREDGHPVVVMAGADIAAILQANGYDTVEKLDKWIDSIVV